MNMRAQTIPERIIALEKEVEAERETNIDFRASVQSHLGRIEKILWGLAAFEALTFLGKLI